MNIITKKPKKKRIKFITEKYNHVPKSIILQPVIH